MYIRTNTGNGYQQCDVTLYTNLSMCAFSAYFLCVGSFFILLCHLSFAHASFYTRTQPTYVTAIRVHAVPLKLNETVCHECKPKQVSMSVYWNFNESAAWVCVQHKPK